MPLVANAHPTKKFFIGNLTRDLSLEDAILDLIDNSIDGYIRTHSIDVSPAFMSEDRYVTPDDGPLIKISISDSGFEIADRCGGIGTDRAVNYAFRLGNAENGATGALGVYGIGMKRALFKMGREFTVVSRTTHDGFRLSLDVDKWASNDDSWEIPLSAIRSAPNPASAGTTITIRRLTPEVALRLKDPTLHKRIAESAGATYAIFLDKFLSIEINGVPVRPRPLPLGDAEGLTPGVTTTTVGDVTVEILAGLATRVRGEWNIDRAGWFVVCNGRVVVFADKSDLTGWGINGPQFVSKYRGFVGIAYFFSKNPSALPWTTTKRGLNRESEVYQVVRSKMTSLARPVLSFLDRMYRSEAAEEPLERAMTEHLEPASVQATVAKGPTAFSPPRARGTRDETVTVQFKAKVSEIDRVRRRLGKRSNWAAGRAGRHALDYFLERECPT